MQGGTKGEQTQNYRRTGIFLLLNCCFLTVFYTICDNYFTDSGNFTAFFRTGEEQTVNYAHPGEQNVNKS